MKIAFIQHSFGFTSGIDTVTYELSKRISKKHDVTIFTFNNEYDSNIGIEIKESSIPFKKNRVFNAVLSPIFIHKIAEIQKSIKKYDVVNSHMYPANIIPLLPTKIENPLNVVIAWSTEPIKLFPKLTEKLYFAFLKKANGYAVKRADEVIAPCDFVKQWIKKDYGVEATEMFLDGVNFDLFDKKTSGDSIYHKYPFLEDSPVILYVGRLTPHKNIDILIKSFKIVKSDIPDAKLVIVGKKSFLRYFEYLKRLVRDENLEKDVLFTDVVPWVDLPKYYTICDVYATCSQWEGFLRAEAFAMEKPIVAFDVTSHGETVKHRKNGLLVKEQTPEAFANALIELLLDDNLRRVMGRNGYKWAKENLDFDVIAENFMNFVENKWRARR